MKKTINKKRFVSEQTDETFVFYLLIPKKCQNIYVKNFDFGKYNPLSFRVLSRKDVVQDA